METFANESHLSLRAWGAGQAQAIGLFHARDETGLLREDWWSEKWETAETNSPYYPPCFDKHALRKGAYLRLQCKGSWSAMVVERLVVGSMRPPATLCPQEAELQRRCSFRRAF